jgi:hypothetical protein
MSGDSASSSQPSPTPEAQIGAVIRARVRDAGKKALDAAAAAAQARRVNAGLDGSTVVRAATSASILPACRDVAQPQNDPKVAATRSSLMTMHVRNQNDNVDIVRDRYGAAENPN